MRRIERWMAPLVLCTVAACAAPKDRVGLDGFEKPGEDIAELTRERGVEREPEPSDEARLTKWERVAGHSQRETLDRREEVVDAYPPRGEEIPESAPIYDPQEPDLCEDFYYELCETHAGAMMATSAVKLSCRVLAAAIPTPATQLNARGIV